MILTGQQRGILKEGILGAYPNEDKLRILLSEKMDLSYSAIARGNHYASRVSNLVQELGADGEVEKLIKVIREDKPNSPYLTQLEGVLISIDMNKRLNKLSTLLQDGGHENFQTSFNYACNILKFRHKLIPTIREEISNPIYRNNISEFIEKLHGIISREYDCVGQKPTLLYIFVKDFLKKVESDYDGQLFQYRKLFVKEIKTWLEEYAINQHLQEIPWQDDFTMPRPCLLIKVSKETEMLQVQHWIIQDLSEYNVLKEKEGEKQNCLICSLKPVEIPIPVRKRKGWNAENYLSILRKSIHEIITQEVKSYKISLQGVFDQTALEEMIFDSIEIFVPHAFIAEIDSPDFNLFGMENISEICKKITLRFSERLKPIDDSFTIKWRNRYDNYKRRIELLDQERQPNQDMTNFYSTFYSTTFYQVDESPSQKFLNNTLEREEDIVAVAICKLDVNKRKFKSVMETLWVNGIPLAFWTKGSQHSKEAFNNIFTGDPKTLLENIFRRRQEGHMEVYNDLSVIWDDSDRVPPTYSLLKMP